MGSEMHPRREIRPVAFIVLKPVPVRSHIFQGWEIDYENHLVRFSFIGRDRIGNASDLL